MGETPPQPWTKHSDIYEKKNKLLSYLMYQFGVVLFNSLICIITKYILYTKTAILKEQVNTLNFHVNFWVENFISENISKKGVKSVR